ncbi:MAG: Ig-like domain-containing protein [Acidobacteria bacterium]|nr:Ig-like domain-containing protein [Acidobacteriota bacterium]MBV8894695.1 Ig-like domain-containing protein [Acidobacteriota bacterium]MBV9484214.1 Ig-like domain-containing protein [Acidobacteriota bacterium]
MESSWSRAFALGVVVLAALLSIRCGNKQQLISIQVTPAEVNFQGPGAQTQMTAMGSYIHPPATKDITNAVTWATDVPGTVRVTQTGLVTAINTCGSGQVTATAYSNPANPAAGSAIRGSADVAILLNGSSNCSQLANLTVTIGTTGGGSGVVTSSPSGISCPSICSANFAVGTTVTLTALPNGGSSVANWIGCDSTSLTTCVITMNAARTVTANFS